MASAFCIPTRLGAPSFDPSLVGECTRRFGHRRGVSTYHQPNDVSPTGFILTDHTQCYQSKGQRIAYPHRWRWLCRRSRKYASF